MTHQASASFFSLPNLRRLMSFHHGGGTACRCKIVAMASSIALANGTMVKSGERETGSMPNTSLQVNNLVLLAELPEQGKKKVVNFVAAAECDKGEKPGLCYEELSLLALATPRLVVRVEDAVAEDVEVLREFVTFGVIVEVDVEDVVDVGGVARDEQLHAGEPGAEEKEGAAGGAENVGGEVVEAVEVDGKTR
ncbi:hypothetical protein M5K25_021845 [Dendrobium thyrsiflorum]|uniref:Uncharacterized protein n=1 Tax=Dendrobium thyrsiflorum TaxID=117978 RepID=A0ABD0U527_DENTH